MARKFLRIILAATLLPLFASQALALNWINIPGRIVFDGDSGHIVSTSFHTWGTNKKTFIPGARSNDIRIAGNFTYTQGDKHVVMRITDADHYELNGDYNPITIILPDKSQIEATVVDSFIWAICRCHTFSFKALDPDTGKDVLYEVPSESIKTLYFFDQ